MTDSKAKRPTSPYLDLQQLSRVVRERRLKANMTQQELAAKCPGAAGVSIIQKIEQGFSSVRLVTICAIARGLGMGLAEFFEEIE